MAYGACIYCKIPVLKDDYTSIPCHVQCLLRNGKDTTKLRTKGIDYSGVCGVSGANSYRLNIPQHRASWAKDW